MCIYAINTEATKRKSPALPIESSALVELQQYTFRAHLGHTDRLGEGRRAQVTNQRLLYSFIVNYTKGGRGKELIDVWGLFLDTTWLTEMPCSSSRYSTAC